MSTEKIKHGGQAFPMLGEAGYNSDWQTDGGMSLRDWFAGVYNLGADGISKTWAEKVMGSGAPDWMLDNGMDCIRWWCEAEARIRFLHADAMLKAREAQS